MNSLPLPLGEVTAVRLTERVENYRFYKIIVEFFNLFQVKIQYPFQVMI